MGSSRYASRQRGRLANARGSLASAGSGQPELLSPAFACHSRPIARSSAGYTPTYRKGEMVSTARSEPLR